MGLAVQAIAPHPSPRNTARAGDPGLRVVTPVGRGGLERDGRRSWLRFKMRLRMRCLEELTELGVLFVLPVELLDGDAESDAGFVEGGHGSYDALEFALQGEEEFGEVHLVEAVFEPLHGHFAGSLLIGVAEIADVMSADILVFDGDLAAELSVGKIELAEADWHGHGLSLKRKGPHMAVLWENFASISILLSSKNSDALVMEVSFE